MKSDKKKNQRAVRRANRVRSLIAGTAQRPRLTVKRSAKHIYAQVIDDVQGQTIAAASDKDVPKEGKPVDIAKAVGKVVAERTKAKGVSSVVFDRGPYRYHGRVVALADGAREGGLTF